MENNKKTAARIGAVLIFGAAAGFVNGFLGAGGGIILMYMFRRMSMGYGNSSGRTRDVFASVVATVLPLSAVSAAIYGAKGMGDTEVLLRFAVPAAAGGLMGAYLTDRLDTKLLGTIFAVIMIVGGMNMLL